MILSHEHRFVFLKTNKTGGTSIEIALSRYCGPDDIITPISPEDEATRRALGYRGPQNCRFSPGRYRPRHVAAALRNGKPLKFFNHMGAREVRLLAGDAVWRDYFTFCFERNPWDRVLSLYYYRCPDEPRPDLDAFVASDVVLNLKEKGSDLYTAGDDIVVDRVCRFEHLRDELEHVAATLGLPGPLEPPHAKGRFRGQTPPREPVFSAASDERIRTLFAFEIERFGYRSPSN